MNIEKFKAEFNTGASHSKEVKIRQKERAKTLEHPETFVIFLIKMEI